MLAKNTAGQGVYLYAHDTLLDVPATGDGGNITAHVGKDGAAEAPTATTNPTEIGGGIYWQPLSQGETNADALAVRWASTTTGVQIDPVTVLTDRAVVADKLDVATSTRASATAAPSWWTAPANPSDYARDDVAPSWYTSPPSFPSDYARDDVAPSWYTDPVDVSANVSAIKARTDLIPDLPAAINDPMTLNSTEYDAIAATVFNQPDSVESGEAFIDWLRLVRSVLVGVSEESGGVVQYKRRDGATTAVTVTVADNSRTEVVIGTLG